MSQGKGSLPPAFSPALLIEAVKEQQAQIAALQAELAALKGKVLAGAHAQGPVGD